MITPKHCFLLKPNTTAACLLLLGTPFQSLTENSVDSKSRKVLEESCDILTRSYSLIYTSAQHRKMGIPAQASIAGVNMNQKRLCPESNMEHHNAPELHSMNFSDCCLTRYIPHVLC